MSSSHTLFLTGANGFIGSHILERLLHLGHQATCFLRPHSDTARIQHLLDHPGFSRVDASGLEEYFREHPPYAVIHVATCYRKHHTAGDIEEMISSNVTFPTQIAQLCVTHGVKYFVNTGTFFEYDFSDAPLTESSREKSFNLYASTKLALNTILRYYTEQYDFHSVILRLFSPYGPRDNEKLIPVAIRSLLHGTEMKIPNATQRLSFTYVDDIVDAYVLLLEKIDSLPQKYDTINIAPSETYSILEVLQRLEKVSGKKLTLSLGNGTEQEIWHSSFGSTYAKELLGWEAKTSLDQGLLCTYNSYL